MFGKSLYQQEYKVLRKGLEAGLSKQQISNFLKQPRSGMLNGKIRADFYDISRYSRSISIGPCPKEFVAAGRLLPRKQNKAEAYYTRGRNNN